MSIEGEYVPGPSNFVSEQVERYERSGGAEANTFLDTGLPIVVVTMRGHRTGYVRKVALMRVEHDGEYALVGSVGGRPTDPLWVRNLRADPDAVTIQDGPAPFGVTVREVHGEEWARWFERAIAAYGPYEEYRQRTDRVFPIFVATPQR